MKWTVLVIVCVSVVLKTKGQNICSVKYSVDTINITSFFKQKFYADACKFSIIDSITSRFNFTGKVAYIKKLTLIYKQSDGVFTEQIMSSCSKIFDSRLNDWFKSVYENKADTSFKKMFVESISIKMSEGKETERIVNDKLDRLCGKLNNRQKNYLQKIRKDLNPHILD